MKVALIVVMLGFSGEPLVSEAVPMKDLAQCETAAAKALRVTPPAEVRSVTVGCSLFIGRLAAR